VFDISGDRSPCLTPQHILCHTGSQASRRGHRAYGPPTPEGAGARLELSNPANRSKIPVRAMGSSAGSIRFSPTRIDQQADAARGGSGPLYFLKDSEKTDGIRITEWPLRLNRDEHVRLNIWDFGGQEIMHATHQFFLTERSLYLLVLTGREGSEDADAQYWLKFIDSFGAESPIIVVLNKINVHPFDLNRRGLQQKYPAIREFIKTDCEVELGLSSFAKPLSERRIAWNTYVIPSRPAGSPLRISWPGWKITI
jgi:hypothetical protein